jgi:serine/threonine protein kinase
LDKIGKYQILGKLGEGGMGVVYKALDPLLDRVVALKTISARLDSEPELRSHFFREGRSAAQLSHKNIITVYDLGEDDGQAYLALEYLEGEDLKEKIRKQEILALSDRLRIVIEICEGLSHAHNRQVIHHDIKPANIFITRAGQVKILDFGLARLMSADTTQSGVMRGSPSYMSPEQIRGVATDRRSDIFSAGSLFYELLTCRKPFDGESVTATIARILYHDPEPPSRIDPSVEEWLSDVIMRALAKDPDRRYQSIDELLMDLKAHSPVSDEAPGTAGLSPVATRSLFASPVTAKDPPDGDAVSRAPSPEIMNPRKRRLPARYTVAAILSLAAVVFFAWKIVHLGPAANVGAETTSPPPAPEISQSSMPPAAASSTQSLESPPNITPVSSRDEKESSNAAAPKSDPVQSDENSPGMLARGQAQAGKVLNSGKDPDTSTSPRKPIQGAPSEPATRRLEDELVLREKAGADDALRRMADSRRIADDAKAGQYAGDSYAAALKREMEARNFYETQRYSEAAAAFFEASGLYRSAALEGESERKARENQALLDEQARLKARQRDQAYSSRSVYEREQLEASKAGVEERLPQKYREAGKLADEAKSKWDQEDFASAGTTYDRAAEAMRQARKEAEASLKVASPVSDSGAQTKRTAPAASPPSPEEDQAAVMTTLQRYASALQSRDIKLLRGIWPDMRSDQEKALAQEFSNARQIEVRFANVEVNINGDAAVVTARRTYVLESVDGQRPRIETRMTMSLRREGTSWLIETIRFEPYQRQILSGPAPRKQNSERDAGCAPRA